MIRQRKGWQISSSSIIFFYFALQNILWFHQGAFVFSLNVGGKKCLTSDDCPPQTVCVAGAGSTGVSVQRCVPIPICSGEMAGNCPIGPVSGDENSFEQLTCAWMEQTQVCQDNSSISCKDFDGKLGIFKCITLELCDIHFQDSKCKDACAVNGDSCNNRGSCYSNGTDTFSCQCNSGWTGPRCETPINDSCTVDVGQCGLHGFCNNGTCECLDKWHGMQCEKSPSSSGSNTNNSDDSKGSASDGNDRSRSSDGSQGGKGSPVTSSGGETKIASWIIALIVIASLIILAIVFFLIMRRKREYQQEEGNAEYNDMQIESLTPKGSIATM